MDAAGVDRALIHPVLWDPDSNELAIKAVRAYPDRFAIMGWFYLDDPNGRLAGAAVFGLQVNGFEDVGIFMLCVDRFAVRFSETHDNGEYGIFPSHSTHGNIAFNLATGEAIQK